MVNLRGLVFLAAVLGPAGALAGGDQLGPLGWLEGSWMRETESGVGVETWSRVSGATMEGIVTLSRGGESVVMEDLRLELMGGDVFYVAKPRENHAPVAFRLVEHTDQRFVFQNPGHDFPQQITYVRTNEHSLVVEISKIPDGGGGIAFEFERVPPKSQVSASTDQFEWLVGVWEGEGFGGSVEEVWTRPRGGSMLGVFRLVTSAGLEFSEHMLIHETKDGPELRLKHFNADLTGWEEKAEYISFPLQRSAPGLADFGGVKYERTDDGLRITVHIAEGSNGSSTTVLHVRPGQLAKTR